jgi:hypothetical protein
MSGQGNHDAVIPVPVRITHFQTGAFLVRQT